MSHAWKLRYAPHLGYLPSGEPLFNRTVGNSDPSHHVAFAAGQGFGGVLYPWATSRPDEEVARFCTALESFDIASGCIVFAPLEAVMSPLWVQDGIAAWESIGGHFSRSIPLARSLGAGVVAVLVTGDPQRERKAQEDAAVEHLRRAGELAAEAGIVIGIEPMVDLPNMLLTNTDETLALLDRVGHPAVRMIFDTGHIKTMDGDVLAAYRRARNHIGLIQLADMPGRIEPGAGTIDFASLLSEAWRDGNADGLIELEHGWSQPTVDAERKGLAALRNIDANISKQ
ncbi:TIM barrel protein [uncultured Sphingosinicella sp.]|uniref:TIM barrel protein n=1 Tax=uncultured Sphingosinicella sp. TaxID=478748 RepID=UPI0030D99A92|tara:strand:- start:32012 stop:32866 length:855 start_codon:yes stop_codon:yes gene_type:complete